MVTIKRLGWVVASVALQFQLGSTAASSAGFPPLKQEPVAVSARSEFDESVCSVVRTVTGCTALDVQGVGSVGNGLECKAAVVV
jgi:hypothetical protein